MYEKKVTISNAHPDNKPTQSMTIKLSGGSPWYGYLWIEGEIYTITFGGRNYTVKRNR